MSKPYKIYNNITICLHFYVACGRTAKHCDQHACVFVCLSVCTYACMSVKPRMSKPHEIFCGGHIGHGMYHASIALRGKNCTCLQHCQINERLI